MRNTRLISLVASAAMALTSFNALACTRFIYETGANDAIVGRSMDWAEDPGTDLWSFPRGLERDGGVGPGSVKWTAKYGSVIASFYNIGTVDGMNDAGLVVNALYLVESDYGDAKASGKPLISIGAWTQYALDNYSAVAEAVEALSKEPFAIVAPELPNGRKAGGHLSLADASGEREVAASLPSIGKFGRDDGERFLAESFDSFRDGAVLESVLGPPTPMEISRFPEAFASGRRSQQGERIRDEAGVVHPCRYCRMRR